MNRSVLKLVALVASASLPIFVTAARAEHIVFPEDAGVINVKNPPYNAQGDGETDDTAAIQAAIRFALDRGGRYSKPPFVYFPAGTYLVTGELQSRIGAGGWSDGWRAGMILVGESGADTVIKLADDAPGYDNPAVRRAVIKTGSESDTTTNPGGGGNRAFRHSIINLTVDTGSGNPGAVGIDYLANNRGAVEKVTVRSGDGQGYAGILMSRNWPGPAMIKNVRIEGFDYGVYLEHYEYSMTFEHLTLVGQNILGIRNSNNVLNIRDLVSDNAVPVIRTSSGDGHITLIDGAFTGGAPDSTAVINGAGKLYARNVTASGYRYTITSSNGERSGVNLAGTVGEFSSHSVRSLFDSPQTALHLPIEETPEYHTADLDRWVNPVRYGATPDNAADDDADAIQAAIDSGLPLVYLPNGDYHVGRPLILRGDVRKIMGMQSSIVRKSGFTGGALIRFEGGSAEAVVLEHLRLGGLVEHAASQGLAIRHADIDGYRNTPEGTGKLFIEDVIGKPYHIHHPQSVWARQLNAEFGSAPLFENHGGAVWILGMKTEGRLTAIKTVGGATELLGALLYPLGDVASSVPAFINEEGRVSLSYAISGQRYPTQVQERREGESRELLRAGVPGRGNGSNLPLYVGYRE
jgi:hypothetical protein